ncbi:lipopolysaccharide biosynthesis protein [Butyrivibrio sp. YAB3001]|uniref:lipopolysaccharide biosynthesis protein n=1 Tax=Butyrivibrio sp. YAB3001 TaxID=1520812 RepID=UPI0008F63870|nr:oligosaccharide flippase family protein [Butyrivibrio sp. YAB3001]SFD00332.1 Membrane protein involved in the export of O-antigen and teichoic acid [Butyrivibrio sp. YAB3001]
MSRIINARRNIIWGVLNKLINILIPFALRTAIIYFLGHNYLGLDTLFNSILQMLNIAELGFSSAITFSMYKPLSENDTVEVCSILSLYRIVYKIIGLSVLVIGLIMMPFLPKLIKSGLPDDVNLYLLYLVFLINTVLGYLLFAYKKSLLSACQREDVVSKITTVVGIIKIFFQVLILLITRRYYAFIIAMPVSTVIENLITQYIAMKIYPMYTPRGSISKESADVIKTRIKGLVISRLCTTSRNSMDSIIISAYLGLAQAAIYGNYYYIVAAAHGMLTTITKSIAAIVGNTIVKNTPESNYNDMLSFDFLYMWLASFCTTCLVCIYQPFMTIWMGNELLLPDGIMIMLSIYFYSLCMGDVRTTYYTACGLWWEGRYRSMIEAASNIVLNILLGKLFGIAGVVLATLFSIIVINFGYGSTIIHRYYFKGISSKTYFKKQFYYAFVTIISAFLCFKICSLHSVVGFPAIMLDLALCFMVSNALMILFYFRLSEFKKGIELISKVVRL